MHVNKYREMLGGAFRDGGRALSMGKPGSPAEATIWYTEPRVKGNICQSPFTVGGLS